LADEDITRVQSLVEGEIEENKGMAMMFNLVEAAREWLRDKVNASGVSGLSPEEQKKVLEAEEERRILEQRSHGTPVTEESFLEWKFKFQEELRALAAKFGSLFIPVLIVFYRQGRGKQEDKSQLLTGKQFFLAHEGEDLEEGEEEQEDEVEEDGEEFEINYSDDGRFSRLRIP